MFKSKKKHPGRVVDLGAPRLHIPFFIYSHGNIRLELQDVFRKSSSA
jgi:hypothetical protein